MKTMLRYGSLCLLLLFIFACQKEAPITEITNETIATDWPNPLLEIKDLLPDNVEVLTDPTSTNRDNATTNVFFGEQVELTDCEQQHCHQFLPNYLRKMQRMANRFCMPIMVDICCCAKGTEWCYRFKVNPAFACGKLSKEVEGPPVAWDVAGID
ncbi:MAG: hypothetical protein AAF960_04575 [Bacteroidota bacterium]